MSTSNVRSQSGYEEFRFTKNPEKVEPLNTDFQINDDSNKKVSFLSVSRGMIEFNFDF
jgi:hypothetical protein